jgi:exopolysaccharide/PEP-CTERM locus tyrosine autokinase
VTIVERAIEKLRRANPAHPGTAPARPVGSVVDDSLTVGEQTLPTNVNARRIVIDREALRESGYLPEASRDRQFADHYRQIKRPLVASALAPSDAANSPRLIMMASALPGDGKTFTSINLALSLARERDISVILVDADVPKPHVSRIFGVDEEPGLMDALSNPNIDVDSLLLPTDVGSLSILPAGRQNEGATELLSSARMSAVVARLLARSPRRIVLFDSPPLLVSSESRAVAAVCGHVVLVVRSGTTPRQAVLESVEQLGKNKPVSLVLNQGRMGIGGYYGYGAYGYGDNQAKDSGV